MNPSHLASDDRSGIPATERFASWYAGLRGLQQEIKRGE